VEAEMIEGGSELSVEMNTMTIDACNRPALGSMRRKLKAHEHWNAMRDSGKAVQ
jgi:hypothetical protein